MRLAPRAVLVLLLALVLAPFALAETEPPADLRGRLVQRDGVHVLELWGTPGERGFAHGWLLGEEIIRGFSKDLGFMLGDRAKATLARLGPLVTSGFRFSDSETKELEGILAGIRARLPEEKRVVALLGREITLLDLKLVNTVGDWYALGCSSAARWGGPIGPAPVVVRNFDFPVLDILTVQVHVRVVAPLPGEPKRRGWVGVSHPGSIGAITVLNEEGVFAAIHDVGVRPGMTDFMQPNVPRLVAIRRLAEELGADGAVEAARDKLRGWSTLYGNNFMVVTPRPGSGLPAGVLEYDTHDGIESGATLGSSASSEDEGPFLVCTNHHRARSEATGCRRYARLVEACEKPYEKAPTVDDLFALANHAAVPSPGRTVVAGGFGTLHQAVAITGEATLWLRFVPLGSNVRDAKPVRFRVPELLDGLGERAAD